MLESVIGQAAASINNYVAYEKSIFGKIVHHIDWPYAIIGTVALGAFIYLERKANNAEKKKKVTETITRYDLTK